MGDSLGLAPSGRKVALVLVGPDVTATRMIFSRYTFCLGLGFAG